MTRMVLSSKIQGLNYGAPFLGWDKSMYFLIIVFRFHGTIFTIHKIRILEQCDIFYDQAFSNELLLNLGAFPFNTVFFFFLAAVPPKSY